MKELHATEIMTSIFTLLKKNCVSFVGRTTSDRTLVLPKGPAAR